MTKSNLTRSALYLPATNSRALEKAKSLHADILIFDLEDSVAPEAKDQARAQACSAIASGAYGQRELVLRINGRGTAWHDDDVRAAVEVSPAAILVPKINSATDIHALEQTFGRHNASASLELWAMIETAASVLRVSEIARASTRLTTLVMGTNDLLLQLNAEATLERAPLLTSLSLCLLAARDAGKTVLDGVYNNLTDNAGFEVECRQARQFGFDGKTLVHPNQIESCNQIFTPSTKDVEQARNIINAYERAKARGQGVATVDGQMIENLHAERAQRLVGIAEAIKARANE